MKNEGDSHPGGDRQALLDTCSLTFAARLRSFLTCPWGKSLSGDRVKVAKATGRGDGQPELMRRIRKYENC